MACVDANSRVVVHRASSQTSLQANRKVDISMCLQCVKYSAHDYSIHGRPNAKANPEQDQRHHNP